MSEKTKKSKDSKYPQKCHQCQFFDTQKDNCTKGKDKCNTDFSKCDTFLVRESLVMY